MSLAGVRSNRGDSYQTTMAMDWAIRMLTDERVAWIEVDSTALGPGDVPIGIDDIVVEIEARATYCQCKKNQPDFNSWKVHDLKDDLRKAAETLARDPIGRVIFYSRSPFGELHKLQEYAKTQPTAEAYRVGLTAELLDVHLRLQTAWAPTDISGDQTFEHLKRLNFRVTDDIEPLKQAHLLALRQIVTRAQVVYDVLWTRLDQLGARIEQASAREDSHRLTREQLLELLARHGISVSAPRPLHELKRIFADLSIIGRSWKRQILGRAIPRDAVDQLLHAIEKGERCILLSDGPGSGKTCVLLDLLDRLAANPNQSSIFVQARAFAHCKSDDERKQAGFPPDFVGLVSQMAEHCRTVVVIDSLDVLSLARDHKALQFFLTCIDQLGLRPNVSIVVACRSFDLQYDAVLYARDWSHTITIGPLRWKEDIEPLLRDWGVPPEQLDADTRVLLANPRNLALFSEIVQRAGPINVVTSAALNRRYLEVVVENDDNLGRQALQALEDLAQRMLRERHLESSRSRLSMPQDMIARLLSADVLHATESGNFTFGHQTLLDALAVGKADREGVSLIQFIRSLPAVPFVRPAVRAFFTYLRASDPKAFRAQVRTVMQAPDIAYHFKRLLAESFADLVPVADDWPLILSLVREQRPLFLSLYSVCESPAWCEFWHEHLTSLIFAEKQADLLDLQVAKLAKWIEYAPQAVIDFWSQAVRSAWLRPEQVRANVAYRLRDFREWSVPKARELLALLLATRGRTRDGLGLAISRYVEATDSGDDLLWEYIAGDVGDHDVLQHDYRQHLRCAPHELCDGEFLARRMKRSEALLESAIAAVDTWSIRHAKRYGRIKGRDEFLSYTSYGMTHSSVGTPSVNAVNVLLQAIEAAVVAHAVKGTDWWSRRSSELSVLDEAAFRYVVIQGCRAAPSENVVLIGAIVSNRKQLESRLRFELQSLINVSFPFLSEADQDRTTELVLDLYEDQRRQEGAEYSVLRERADYLQAIPAMCRSRRAADEFARLERMFWPIVRAPHIDRSAGSVRPPFSFEQFFGMSDQGIVKLVVHYGQGDRELYDFSELIGGSDQVASQLREAASRDPLRFLALLRAHWDTIPQVFREALLSGATRYLQYEHGNLKESSGQWKPQVKAGPQVLGGAILDELERHPQGWLKSAEGADALQACAHVVESEVDAHRLIACTLEYINLQDPALDTDDKEDLVTQGIGSMRGRAAEGLITLAARRAESAQSSLAALRGALTIFAGDGHPAVRAVVLSYLPWLQHRDPALGWDVFAKAIRNADDRLWVVAERCFYFAYHSEFARVSPYLQLIEESGSGEALETWGRISALACLSDLVPWPDLKARLQKRASADAWRGAVTVFASNPADPQHRALCFEGLTAAFEGAFDPQMVAEGMEPLFYARDIAVPVPYELIDRMFTAYESAKDNGRLHLHDVQTWSVTLASTSPDLALEVAERFARFIPGGSAQFYDYKPMGMLLTRLFREAEEREASDSGAMLARVIALQDTLLKGGISGLDEWLRAAERP